MITNYPCDHVNISPYAVEVEVLGGYIYASTWISYKERTTTTRAL